MFRRYRCEENLEACKFINVSKYSSVITNYQLNEKFTYNLRFQISATSFKHFFDTSHLSHRLYWRPQYLSAVFASYHEPLTAACQVGHEDTLPTLFESESFHSLLVKFFNFTIVAEKFKPRFPFSAGMCDPLIARAEQCDTRFGRLFSCEKTL